MKKTKTVEEIQYNSEIKQYKTELRRFLLTSRFNTQTLEENRIYREKKWNTGCIYCTPEPIARYIPVDAITFVLEMNNDINKIAGIGLVKNKPHYSKYIVYEHDNYNRYTYIGKHRIARQDMTAEEDEIMQVFDILCFTGNSHMKRGQGLKMFPIDMLYRCSKILNLVDFIQTMFFNRMNNKNK